MNTYSLFVPKQAVGANLVYWDLFNAAGSEARLLVRSVLPIVSGAVAVSGVLGVDLLLTHTTAVGTTGTAATYNGTDITAATFTPRVQTASKLNGNITARLTPGGGATASGIISMTSVFTEETGFAYMGNADEMIVQEPVLVPEGYGIRVIQGAVASVGNIGFCVIFDVLPKP